MTIKKKKSNAGRKKIADPKIHTGFRASQKGINNCKSIAEKTGQTYGSVASKALEAYNGGGAA